MAKDKHGSVLEVGDVVDHENGNEMGVIVKIGPPYGGDDPDCSPVTIRRYESGRDWAFPSTSLVRIKS